ncbi:CBN-LGC-45 protein [Aphelenchoides avenae]|nr:CBN-LGC-45 protein [Aphelenchus avenae]
MGHARFAGGNAILESEETTEVPSDLGGDREDDIDIVETNTVGDKPRIEESGSNKQPKETTPPPEPPAVEENETAINETTEPPRDDVATVPVLEEVVNKTILWIDATYKAQDIGLNLTTLPECEAWDQYWSKNSSTNATVVRINGTDSDEELDLSLVEYELIDKGYRLEELGLNKDLLEEFKEELQPNTDTLTKLALLLNEMIHNKTTLGEVELVKSENDTASSAPEALPSVTNADSAIESTTIAAEPSVDGHVTRDDFSWQAKNNLVDTTDASLLETAIGHQPHGTPHRVVLRLRRQAENGAVPKAVEATDDDDEEDWLEDIAFESREILSISRHLTDKLEQNNESLPMDDAWIQIDATDETSPLMYILSTDAAEALNLVIPKHHFQRYEKVVLYLPGVCADYVPTAIDEFNATDFEGVDIEGPIGVNISALEAAGVNLTELAEKLRNDTEVDDILSRTNGSMRTLGGSYILPVLHKNQYDPFSAPIVFQGSAVVVRFGIYIESMSNFGTHSMDYDMDIYLLMSWRDARLVNPYDKPILVKEEEILEKLWRPDPFFANAKEAEFHEVTFLNFLMRIFNDGLVLYETRLQTCELQIKSFAYPIETVRFEWFTRKQDAIDKNPDVKLPELYIDRYEPTVCNRTRKAGDFSCLRAVFRLKRDVGFHIAQTYIPTSLALMFSWVGVWLPEEFMEGRIGVAITVLLTLSTESAGAREHLPSVSYLKAIDLWFGYITGFVFFTLLQTLFVIGFDKRANQLRKWATKKRSDVTQEARDAMLNKANRYHKTGRYLDNFCRVFYPLSFVLFLIMYYFVFTEGRQDDCISTR